MRNGSSRVKRRWPDGGLLAAECRRGLLVDAITLRIGVAAEVPDLDDEGLLFLKGVARAWPRGGAGGGNADVPWTAYDLVLERSTWDYAGRPSSWPGPSTSAR